jgi:hypothetical protein
MAMHASDSVKKKTHTVTDGHFRLITEKEYTVLSIFKKKSGKASFCEKKIEIKRIPLPRPEYPNQLDYNGF